MKYADKGHFRIEEEKEFYKDLLNIYHEDYLKLDRDLNSIKIKLSKTKTNIEETQEKVNSLQN